jgi:signal transduction histidine kinase
MRPVSLAQRLTLALATLVLVVAGLVAWYGAATSRLTAENRAIVARGVPAARLEVSLLESVSALRRLEARHAVLGDPAYLRLFGERAEAAAADLAHLETLVGTPGERAALAEVRDRLASYRAAVLAPGPRGTGGADAAQRLEAALEALYARSDAELRRRTAAAEAREARLRAISVVAIALTAVVGALTSGFVVLRVARPLRRLRDATRDVARREFARPIPVRGRDEVAQLTGAFNDMAAWLREVDQLKADLFASLSHDLRSPLAAVSWSAEMLASEVPGPLTARQVRLVESIQLSCRRVLGLVNQILDLGKLRAGKLTLECRPTDLRELLEGCLDEVRPLADQAGLTLGPAKWPDELPPLVVDPGRLHQVFLNLLSNAVKFTPTGGTVSVAVDAAPDAVTVRVSDTGIGIPPALQATIFDRYQQGHHDRGGSGLGLAVVKEFVVAHGGRVEVRSEEGHGSCFTVVLPREPQEVAA